MSFVADTATLVHGYTMGDVDNLARIADLSVNRGLGSMDYTDRRETAWHAVVELLYDSADAPTRRELIHAGMDAITDEWGNIRRHHGMSSNGGEAPALSKYWLPVIGGQPDFTDHLVEKMALPQLLGLLTDKQYEAISALAAFGSQRDAAAHLGVEYKTFHARTKAARGRIVEAWFDPERAPQKRSTADVCKHGHSRAEHGFTNSDGHTDCRVCARNRARRHVAREGTWWSRSRSVLVD